MSEPYNSSLNMKRKHLSNHDDCSYFSLSSPASKIRRLDAPVMDEEEAMSSNDERAIVLFKPMNSYLLHSPNFSVSVDSDFVSGLKNQFPWTNQSNRIKLFEEVEETDDATKECRAVVPWVPSQFPSSLGSDISPSNAPEEMEAEEMEEAAMDVEEDKVTVPEQGNVFEFAGIGGSDGLPQCQQQHCMISQLPQNNSTPITWFR